MTRWLDEPLGDGLLRRWRLGEVLWEGDTPYQRMLIARTAHGVTLFCDDERQSAELSQLVYHEALLVPALLLADRVRRVLVVGSSEGVVSQLAVAAGADAVDHVDIDRECVRRCAELLPYGYGVAELAAAEHGDGPVRVHYADGWDFLMGTAQRYDVVVVDLPDERPDAALAQQVAQHNRLYGVDFLRRCRDVLTDGGVLAYQAGCPTLWRNATLARSVARLTAASATPSARARKRSILVTHDAQVMPMTGIDSSVRGGALGVVIGPSGYYRGVCPARRGRPPAQASHATLAPA